MAKTIKGLKTAFKKANRRVDKRIERYKNFIFALYMPLGNTGELADVYLTCLNSDGTIREYASNLSNTFYRKARNGHIYIKPCDCKYPDKYSPCSWCFYCDGLSCDHSGQPEIFYCRDYLDLCKLENAIDLAVDEREQILSDLEKMGVDVWNNAELWN